MSHEKIIVFNKFCHYNFLNDKIIKKNISENEKYNPGDFVEKFLKDNYTIFIIELNLKNIDHIIKNLKKYKITNAIFIIHDVFRIGRKDGLHIPPLDCSLIENDYDKIYFEELEIIKNIILKLKIKKYKIYHCEKVPKKIQKKLKIKIYYFDIFLYFWIKHNIRNFEVIDCKNFNYKVSCFNKRFDYHRTMLTACFFEHKDFFYTHDELLDKNYFFNNTQLDTELFNKEFKVFLLSQCKKFYKKHHYKLDDNYNNLINLEINQTLDNFIKESFVHLVTETRYTTPMQNISEKTVRSIIAKRPFILAGSPGSLKLLRDLGFKTFNRWWSEDYDNEFNHHKRLEMIYNLINDILDADKQKLKNMLNEMQDILDYNYNVYLNFNVNNFKNIN